MRYVGLIMLMWLSLGVHAQQFVTHDEIVLPDTLKSVAGRSIDIDNDGLPDQVLLTTSDSRSYLMFVKGDTLQPMSLSNTFVGLDALSAHHWYDVDNDNQIDLIISPINGEDALVYRNLGEFHFEKAILPVPAFNVIAFADLDDDGVEECIWSGGSGIDARMKTFRKMSDSWVVVHDTLQYELSEVQAIDADRDGTKDLFISGRDVLTDSLFSSLLIGDRKKFSEFAKLNVKSKAYFADADLDGALDIFLYGKTFKGRNAYYSIQTSPFVQNVTNLSNDNQVKMAFHADLNSDGGIDEIVLAHTSDADTLNTIGLKDGSNVTITHKGVSDQWLSDLDQDGDLDIVQLISGTTGFLIRIIENTPVQKNLAPGAPARAIAAPVYNHVLLYWEQGNDDYTPSGSLTYDVYLESETAQATADFDLLNERRLVSSHGDNSTTNFRFYRNLANKNFHFAIQSVDNSLYAGVNGGLCTGSGVGCAVQFVEQSVDACADMEVVFEEAAPVLWFSFASGYLGTKQSLVFASSSNDTVFSLAPNIQGCAVIKTYRIEVKDQINTSTEEISGCEGSQIRLTAPEEWTEVAWTRDGADAGSGTTLPIEVSSNESFIARTILSEHCELSKTINITVSKPTLSVNPETARIFAGGEVTLTASGGVRYEWTPASTVDNPTAASVSVNPLETTKYTITGYDSINCPASIQATVFVDLVAAFIPSLFTPNNDGTNDELRLYGLSTVENFELKIYNREGNIVFVTRNPAEASGRGWDGTTHGVRQPNGLYFWKVEGRHPKGDLLLNGKKEGSFLLVR